MSSGNEIDFEPIQKIFAERDRREAGALKNQRAREAQYYRNSNSRYERTPANDEFRSSRSRTGSSSNAKRRNTSNSSVRNTYSRGKSYSNHRYTGRKNQSAKGKIAGFLAAASVIAAAVGGMMGGGKDAKPIETQNPIETEVVATASPMPTPFTDLEFTVDESQVTATPEVEATEAPTVIEMAEHVSSRMIDSLKSWESLQLEAYYCPGKKLTIGYGHTGGVKEGMKITEKEAEDLLREDLVEFEDYVKTYCKRLDLTLCQADLDAMTSFAYNLGPDTLWESGILQMLAEGDRQGAIDELLLYVNSNHEPLPGLVKRRGVEADWLRESLQS